MLEVDMAQVSAEGQQMVLHTQSGLIPASQCLHRKSMPKIMQPRAATIRRSAKSDLTRELVEGHTNCWPPKPAAFFSDQKVGASRLADQLISPVCVLLQHPLRRRMQRHQTRGGLGGANCENAVSEINV